jgi:hypothetical protein
MGGRRGRRIVIIRVIAEMVLVRRRMMMTAIIVRTRVRKRITLMVHSVRPIFSGRMGNGSSVHVSESSTLRLFLVRRRTTAIM